MKPTERKCPICGGIVVPPRRGGDPDEALARHVELTHGKPKEPREIVEVKL